jgi:transposase
VGDRRRTARVEDDPHTPGSWRRLAEWQQQGVWDRLHEALLAKLNAADQIDWERAAIDSSHVRAFGGASQPARVQWTAERQAPSTT